MSGERNLLISNAGNGGRARTRTVDLLRVKPTVGFSWLLAFYPVLIIFNQLGILLFAQLASLAAA
jgi:hypothetical protein